ncbi:MAG: AAA family ATPase [Firmicutes bacterium]|nr:AAA family ATPase [Bacillota bacterium]
MNGKTLEIALYGKGGIGKSTVCANLSAALALKGSRVLQIGCDPKHDSTRLLMRGEVLPTVLDYLRDSAGEEAVLEHVLGNGYLDVGCIEAGGPKPGIGCAGRGIISAFDFLEKKKVKDSYDIINYDVLGDVVCGGFAVPIRREYADAIFLVTSGEFMALYAANNILRGIRNYDGDKHRRVAGIIFNRRMVAGEEERVERFAKAVSLPICAVVPRSDLFSRAEEEKRTVMEMGIPGRERDVFLELADNIIKGLQLYEAKPLEDDELEECVLGIKSGEESKGRKKPAPVSIIDCPYEEQEAAGESAAAIASPPASRPPLYGCAFNGAATAAIHLTDAIVIAHSPRSCSFYTWQNISAPGRRNLFNRGILMPSAIAPNFESTNMDDHDAVFGGIDKLRESVAAAIAKKPGAVIVISSCVSGIIGDDVISVEDMSTSEVPVIVIPADGDISGDYMSGIEMCLHKLAERLIDRDAAKKPRCVNIIGEAGVSNNIELNYRTMKEMLKGMDISINCRFLGDATAEEVRGLRSAPLNILSHESPDNMKLKAWLEDNYGCSFFGSCLPVGYAATERFLRELQEYFGGDSAVDVLLEKEKESFAKEIERLRPVLSGKKVLMTTINADIDWLTDTAEQAGMEFVWIGVLNYLRQEIRVTSDPARAKAVHEITARGEIYDAIEKYRPDIIITGYIDSVPKGDHIVDSLPMTQRVGFYSGIDVLERWAQLLENRKEGEWTNDRKFFEKYFA